MFRRQALDRGAKLMRADKLVTGHNADDIAETVLMNLLRGDIARLERCTSIVTGKDSALPRCKPFKYSYEKEIVMYAYYNSLDYFSTECIYSPNAYRGYAREFLKELEKIKSRSIVDIIRSGEHFKLIRTGGGGGGTGQEGEDGGGNETNDTNTGAKKKRGGKGGSNSNQSVKVNQQTLGTCERCNYISSNRICKACVLLEGLNKGKARVNLTALVSVDAVDGGQSGVGTSALPNREETSAAVGRRAAATIEIEPKSNKEDQTQQQIPAAASSSSSPAPAQPAVKKGVSATMEMAQKLSSTTW